MEQYNEYPLDENVALLFYLSVLYGMDLESLLLVYDKLGEDMLYIFFIMSGKRLIVPTANKFQSLRDKSREALVLMKQRDPDVTSKQDMEVIKKLKKAYNPKTNRLRVDLGVEIRE